MRMREGLIAEPVTLIGQHVRLEPLSADHVPALARVGLDPDIWRWGLSALTSVDDMRAYVDAALDEQRRGVSLPFAVVERASDEVIGSTRYGNIAPADRRLEIGWTWLAPAHQRTAANTEAKLLLLTHAFESLGAMRVEFKTDALNVQSRTALARLGAVEEGTFRKHMLTASGRVRDSVYFSIVDTDWPAVKTRLTGRARRR
jgi:RimJ/RimL family protein N-acetyltransferase